MKIRVFGDVKLLEPEEGALLLRKVGNKQNKQTNKTKKILLQYLR